MERTRGAEHDGAGPGSPPSAPPPPTDASPAATPPRAPTPATSALAEGPPAPRATAPTASLSPVAVIGGLLLLITLVHLPLIGFGFVYDDGWTITANGFLRQPGDLPLLFSPEAVARHVPDAFRPTLVAFDVLAYQLLGLHAGLHHALSILLHLAVCWLAQRWIALLGAPLELRAATMALYGVLAIHAEAVAVISFREDLLAAALGLGALVLASRTLRAERRPRSRTALAAAALLALACGAKASAAPLPLVWLLAETLAPWSAPRPLRPRLALTAALALGVALALAHTVLLHGSVDPYGADNLRLHAARVGTSAVLAHSTTIHLGYLQQILVPLGLAADYVDAGARWSDPAVALALAALLALLAYGLWAARRPGRPLAALAILGAFALALPTSNLAAMPNMRADRFMYLPSLPICLGLAALALALGRRFAARLARPPLAFAPLLALVIVQGSFLQAHAQVFRSNGVLWARTHHDAPGSARAQALYGEVLLAALDPEERDQPAYARVLAAVRAQCRIAEREDPLDELTHLCFARLAIAERDWASARARLERALAQSPDRNHRILAALAQVHLDAPGPAEARHAAAFHSLERGLAEYPYAPELWAVAGRIHHRLGDPARADLHYARAFELAPERWETTLWAAELALDRGDRAAARALLRSRREFLEAAVGAERASLRRRLRDDARLFPSTLLDSPPVASGAALP